MYTETRRKEGSQQMGAGHQIAVGISTARRAATWQVAARRTLGATRPSNRGGPLLAKWLPAAHLGQRGHQIAAVCPLRGGALLPKWAPAAYWGYAATKSPQCIHCAAGSDLPSVGPRHAVDYSAISTGMIRGALDDIERDTVESESGRVFLGEYQF